MEEAASNIGKNIRKFRERSGLSQAELGRRLGVSQKVISAYERNYRVPSSSILPCVAETLGASTDDLYKSSGEESQNYALKDPLRWEIVEKLEAIPKSELNAVYKLIERYLRRRASKTGAGGTSTPSS